MAGWSTRADAGRAFPQERGGNAAFVGSIAELEPAVRQMIDLGWIAGIEGEERLILLVQPEQTPLAPLLQALLLSPTEATQALWRPWQHMTLADALKGQS